MERRTNFAAIDSGEHSVYPQPSEGKPDPIRLKKILDQALAGEDLTLEAGIFLLQQRDPESLVTIQEAADQLRRQLVGETVTYVINRNINFTNICEQHCNFCAFRRDPGELGSFWLNWEEIQIKTADAVTRGATEICMQGGLNPMAKWSGSSLAYYVRLIETIKHVFPAIHVHAFSPQEIQFIAREDDLSYVDVIKALQAAGLGSMPGTAAEILDDTVRRVICPEKLNTTTWLEIVATAHRIGIPTTSTILYGHIETPGQQINHLEHLRSLQRQAKEMGYPARITEFIVLPFVGEHAPAPLRKRIGRDQPILADALQFTAIARLFLGRWIPNHQPSWVKLGLAGATEALRWGCNDIGGTLMEEHISSMAGARGGSCMDPEALIGAIHQLDRPAQQRDTLYRPARSSGVGD